THTSQASTFSLHHFCDVFFPGTSRPTIFSRDWSSDVCSSDLVVDKAPGEAFTVKITFKNTGKAEGNWSVNIAFEDNSWSQVGARSEERRVGQECRSRWWPCASK